MTKQPLNDLLSCPNCKSVSLTIRQYKTIVSDLVSIRCNDCELNIDMTFWDNLKKFWNSLQRVSPSNAVVKEFSGYMTQTPNAVEEKENDAMCNRCYTDFPRDERCPVCHPKQPPALDSEGEVESCGCPEAGHLLTCRRKSLEDKFNDTISEVYRSGLDMGLFARIADAHYKTLIANVIAYQKASPNREIKEEPVVIEKLRKAFNDYEIEPIKLNCKSIKDILDAYDKKVSPNREKVPLNEDKMLEVLLQYDLEKSGHSNPSPKYKELFFNKNRKFVQCICAKFSMPDVEVPSLDKIIEHLRPLRSHYSCEDCWYSCPLSLEGCCNDANEICNCGFEEKLKKDALAILDLLQKGKP